MTDPVLVPARTALLVMDYQPAVLGGLPDAAVLLKNTGEAIEIVRRRGGHVGFIRVAFEVDDYAAVPATNKAFSAVAAARGLPAEDDKTAIHPDVAPRPGDTVVRKTRVGAFSTTDLDNQLRSRGVDTLVLAGVHTSGVVLSTVRDAADRDYHLLLIEDCVSDPDPHVHEVLMRSVFPRQAALTTVDRLDSQFTGS
jgi:nicotinamidase-related amidase